MLRLPPIYTIDRLTGQTTREEVYGEASLALLYRSGPLGSLLRAPLTRLKVFSQVYGWLQSRHRSRKKIRPFIESFGIDATEFVKNIDDFESFNDFFVRQIKRTRRPLAADNHLLCPTDGRYRILDTLEPDFCIAVKSSKSFTISRLLQDEKLAERYIGGSLVAIRLNPTDCHRVYFPCSGIASRARLINGYWRSVNPVALKKNLQTFVENKRYLTEIDSPDWGRVLMVEVGATAVGSIHQTFDAQSPVTRGKEKSYFSFGGSAVLLLIEPGRIAFDSDLTGQSLEVKCLIGQSLGVRKGMGGS